MSEEKYVYQENILYPQTLNDFLKYLNLNKKRSPNTIEVYARHIVEFMQYIKIYKGWTKEKDIREVKIRSFSNTELRKLRTNDIDEYVQYCAEELKNASGTINGKISALDTFCKYLVRKNIIDNNIVDSVERPEIDEEMVEYITVEQVNELLNAIKNSNNENWERDYCLYELYVNTGARLNELRELNLDKINLKRKTILVKGKGNKHREIELSDNCVETLNQYLIIREKYANKKFVKEENKNSLFLSRKGTRLSEASIQKNLKKYGEMIGLEDLHPHMLRHTAATIMYQNGIDLYQIKEILGHKNIQTTTRYAKVSTEQKRKAINTISQALNR